MVTKCWGPNSQRRLSFSRIIKVVKEITRLIKAKFSLTDNIAGRGKGKFMKAAFYGANKALNIHTKYNFSESGRPEGEN